MSMGLHLKLRQAQGLGRIARKGEKDLLKKEFDSWTANESRVLHKLNLFTFLITKLNKNALTPAPHPSPGGLFY